MIRGLDRLAVAAVLVLAVAGSAAVARAGGPVRGVQVLAGLPAGVACSVPKAPEIRVNLTTDPVDYDFNRDKVELTAMKGNNGANPYAPGTDTATGGLRSDRPETGVGIRWGYEEYPTLGALCFWYDSVDINVALHPKIYVAKDFNTNTCRQAILEHEMKHIAVDREIINDYGKTMGEAVRRAVGNAGALGPYSVQDQKKIEEQLTAYIDNIVKEQNELMHGKMKARQAEVDTLGEYERVSKICDDAEKR